MNETGSDGGQIPGSRAILSAYDMPKHRICTLLLLSDVVEILYKDLSL